MKNLEDIGYTLEQLILYATSKGLGTCWLGGTFTKSSFERMVQLKEHEILPIITPVGYPAENKSLIERMMRYLAILKTVSLGKNASDARTDPFALTPACSMAIFAEPTRFICPAPTPIV
ncbi:nitroreductase family protein [Desulfuribacillus stibiiarsenatis]|uniref:nitroreductase family protein n=1 Tax=Desulfuribacillus stibiiarsenatis TaxID=1390249 RepID=UPI0009F30E7B